MKVLTNNMHFLLICLICVKLTTSTEYEIHKYDGTCEMEKVCTYSLKVPVHVDVQLQVVLDSKAFQISSRLQDYDLSIDIIAKMFGTGFGSPQTDDILKQISRLKNESAEVQKLFNELKDEMNKITSDNMKLEDQLSVINATILDQLVGKKNFLLNHFKLLQT